MDLSKNKPYAVLIKNTNSHPFQPRRVCLEDPVKIGRVAAKCKPSDCNAIFDCKVLSRTHALISFIDGKFMLCDTGSSNGTFVNKVLLSKPGKDQSEGAQFPIFSGDIVQFGVNVIENPRQMTHHCIIAKMELINPDGSEYVQSENGSDLLSVNQNGHSVISCHDLYKLGQLIEDARHREELLEKKLTCLQSLLQNTKEATDTTWQAQINEDCLLTKIEFLETQLILFSKNQSEETLSNEVQNLQNDRTRLEQLSKEQIRKIVEEKIDTKQELVNTSRVLNEKQEEFDTLSTQYDKSQNELLELAKIYDDLSEEKNNQQIKLESISLSASTREEHFKTFEQKIKEELSNEQNNNIELIAKIEALTAEIDFNNIQIQKMSDQLEIFKTNEDSMDEQFDIKNMTLDELNKLSYGDGEEDEEEECEGLIDEIMPSLLRALPEKLEDSEPFSKGSSPLIPLPTSSRSSSSSPHIPDLFLASATSPPTFTPTTPANGLAPSPDSTSNGHPQINGFDDDVKADNMKSSSSDDGESTVKTPPPQTPIDETSQPQSDVKRVEKEKSHETDIIDADSLIFNADSSDCIPNALLNDKPVDFPFDSLQDNKYEKENKDVECIETSTSYSPEILSIQQIEQQTLYQSLDYSNRLLRDELSQLHEKMDVVQRETQSSNHQSTVAIQTLKGENEDLKSKILHYEDLEVTKTSFDTSGDFEEPAVFDDLYEELAYKVDIIGFFSVLPLFAIFGAIFMALSPILRWFTFTSDL